MYWDTDNHILKVENSNGLFVNYNAVPEIECFQRPDPIFCFSRGYGTMQELLRQGYQFINASEVMI